MVTAQVSGLGRLPAETNEFVGREIEMREIDGLLRAGRLVTLVGPGGVGKTRVAVRAATSAVPRFANGTCLVELSALRDPELLPHTIARSLQLPEQAQEAQLDALLAHLADRKLLLILDTCEHLVDACADLAAAILAAAPSVAVLATSREPLSIDGEFTFPIQPLPVLGPGESGDAVELFKLRAAAAAPGFAVTDANRADVIKLCQGLEGIPLAIEMAAGRLRGLSLAELIRRLDHRLSLLTAARAAGGERHATVRNAIAWSYDTCTAHEKALWARLSVFPGSFDIPAATEICASSELSGTAVFETIIHLVDKSLLVRVEPDGDGPPRFRMFDTIREYGAEMLDGSGNVGALRERFLARYLSKARYLAKHLTEPTQLELFRDLRREHDSIRAALQYTLENPAGDQVRQGAELCNALYGYWHIAGLLHEGRYWYAKALGRLPADSSPVRGWALINRCYLGAMQGAADEAVADGEAGIKIARSLRNRKMIGRGYNYLSLALTIADRINDARRAAAKAEPILEELGDRTGLVILDDHWAHLAHLDGKPDETLRYAARCIGRFDGAKEWWASAWAYVISGMALYWEPLQDAETARVLNKGVLLKYELGDMVGIAYCLEIHGWLAVRSGRYERAGWLLGAADPLWSLAGGRLGGTAALEQVHSSSLAAGRAALGARAFDTLLKRGTDAPLLDMVAFAVAGASAPGTEVPPLPQPGALTDREWEVAYLAGAGLSTEQVARQLFISAPVADAHLSSVFRKLGISSAEQLEPWLGGIGTR